MKIALLILISTFFIIGTEIIKRKYALPTTYTRRFIHIGTAIVAGLAPLFATRSQLIIVSCAFIILLLVGRFYKIFSSIQEINRNSLGDIYLPFGVILSALLFLPHDVHIFQFGIFIMGISDPIGGFVGEKYGKHPIKIFNNTKSIEGSIAFFICCVLLTFVFFPFFGYNLLIIPLILTLIECCLIYGMDNVVLPIVASLLAKALFY